METSCGEGLETFDALPSAHHWPPAVSVKRLESKPGAILKYLGPT
jgi:hypothetical protein